jgi:hypothetical protein
MMPPRIVFASFMMLTPLLPAACSLDQFRGPRQVTVNTCEEKALIEDGEDGDDQVLLREGRNGYLYTFVDKAGSTVSPPETGFQMAEGGAEGSKRAIHLTGHVAPKGEVYVGAGLDFKESSDSYDASQYKGISFSAKVRAGTEPHVRFMVGDVNTDPKGKICTACNNDFGITFKSTDEWVRYEVTFPELKQESGWGAPRPPAVDPARVMGVKWQVSVPNAELDLWVDDVAFIGGCPSGKPAAGSGT